MCKKSDKYEIKKKLCDKFVKNAEFDIIRANMLTFIPRYVIFLLV